MEESNPTQVESHSQEQRQHGVEFHVVGIGASAGGVSALQEFFSAVPDRPEVAFIVVQHLAPSHASHMAQILSRATQMKVVQAEDGVRVEPAQVYTIPPDKFLELVDGRLSLSKPFKRSGKHMPIDFLFRSLAEVQRERAIGIVLSGTGSDGALGVREIRGVGGMTMAQEPETAEYSVMPQRAVDTGAVDYVLPPEQMADRMLSYIHRSFPVARQAVQEGGEKDVVEKILHVLSARTQRDFRPYKRSTIRRRIERRMGINQMGDVQEYLEYLRKDANEVRELAREMLIGVTSFFREPKAFEALREGVLEPLVAGKESDEPVRAWVPGCATGEEAYSVAMLLLEVISEQKKRDCRVQVFATDVDERWDPLESTCRHASLSIL